MRHSRLLAVVMAAAVLLAACGGSDAATSPSAATDSALAETSNGGDENAVTDDAGVAVQPAERFQLPEPPADGRYEVGDTFYDIFLSATHLGLVEIPVGPDVFDGGRCYAILLEVTWYDSANYLGYAEEFQPSTTGILSSGAEAVSDHTGVGCEITGLPALGYERSISTPVDLGETKQVHLGAIHVPDGETLDSIQLYGSPRSAFAATVVLDATGTAG